MGSPPEEALARNRVARKRRGVIGCAAESESRGQALNFYRSDYPNKDTDYVGSLLLFFASF